MLKTSAMLGKGPEAFYMCFPMDQYKGDDECVQDFWGGCVATRA